MRPLKEAPCLEHARCSDIFVAKSSLNAPGCLEYMYQAVSTQLVFVLCLPCHCRAVVAYSGNSLTFHSGSSRLHQARLLGLTSRKRGRVGYDHPVIGSTADTKLLLQQWGCTARTLRIVRWRKRAHCSRVAYPGDHGETRAWYRKGLGGLGILDNACALGASGHSHWGDTQTKGVRLDRAHWNKPSILRWRMGNMHIWAYEKSELFYSSNLCLSDSQCIN